VFGYNFRSQGPNSGNSPMISDNAPFNQSPVAGRVNHLYSELPGFRHHVTSFQHPHMTTFLWHRMTFVVVGFMVARPLVILSIFSGQIPSCPSSTSFGQNTRKGPFSSVECSGKLKVGAGEVLHCIVY